MAKLPVDTTDPCEHPKEKSQLGAYVGCGPLPRYQIRRTVENNTQAFIACYDTATDKQAMSLSFVFRWTVRSNGLVKDAQKVKGPANEQAMVACLLERIGLLKFPKPMGGATVKVDAYPFVFRF